MWEFFYTIFVYVIRALLYLILICCVWGFFYCPYVLYFKSDKPNNRKR